MTEQLSFSPEPMPSLSTPIQRTEMITERARPRRHTIISRPDSAMALLSDIEDDNDDQEQQETFDRISGILSSLIQEANEAVNGIEQERVQLLNNNKKKFTSSTIITTTTPVQSNSSKIPRPRKLRVSNTPSLHHRNGSSSSCTSTNSQNTCSALFSPISTSTSATLLSRSPSPTTSKKSLFRHHTVLRPRSCPVPPNRRSMTPIKHKRNNSNLMLISDPITESFKRLDTSMALVESLSRDLATPTTTTTNKKETNGFTFLLLVPLLHIPHSLVTMIFDFCFKEPSQQQLVRHENSFSMSSMIFWACVFAVTNLMVDQVAVIPKKYVSMIKTRRMSLPGTFNIKKKSSKVPATQTAPVKRTWIPATIQQQYQFRLGNDIPQPQKRRNSI